MAIDTCKERPLVRDGSVSGVEGIARREWLVKTTTKYDSGVTVLENLLAQQRVPTYLESHPDNFYFNCRKLTAKEGDGPLWWVVTAEYSTAPLTTEERERKEPNPLLRKAKLSWETIQYTEAIFRDRDGKPITNSTGDYFDPPPERQASYWVCNVEKNVGVVPPWMVDYENSINEAPFDVGGLTAETGAARLFNLRISEELKENDVIFFRFSFALEFRKKPSAVNVYKPQNTQVADLESVTPEGQSLILMDQGLREWTYWNRETNTYDSDGKKFNIQDDNGDLITSPIPLNGYGLVLTPPDPSGIVYFEYKVYESRDFSILPVT